MSVDDNDDQLPSGYRATPPEAGEQDFGLPVFPEAVWLAQMGMSYMDGTTGLAYRLMWGSFSEDGEAVLDDELWLEPHQINGIVREYLNMASNEPTQGA